MRKGLRTLCVGVVDVSPDFYAEWKDTYHKSATAMVDRQEKMEQVAELIERVRHVCRVRDRAFCVCTCTVFSCCVITVC